MLYEFAFMYSKNHNWDFCNEFIYESNWEKLWFRVISTAAVSQ